jgi:PAS domain S-box-containing protein
MTLELGLARRDAHEALQGSHAELESRVHQRTAELSHAVESVQTELLRRSQAERLLGESRERYQMLFDHAPCPMWIVDLETLRFLDVNQAAVRHYGYSREEFLAMTVKDIRPPEDIPKLLAAIPMTGDGPRTVTTWRHRKKDGSLIHVELGLHTFDSNGRRARLVVVNDVTEPLLATERLKESEEQFRKVFEGAPIGMGIVGADCCFLRLNEAFCRMVGYGQEELLGKPFREITHPDDIDKDLHLIGEVIAGKRRSYELEKRYITKSGAILWGHLTVSVLQESGGSPLYLLGMVQDISEQKQVEATRTQLLDRIISAQEEERRRIARELHDGIGQTLTALAVGLRSVEQALRRETQASRLQRLRQMASDAVREASLIARGLRPSVLDDAGLEEALRQYVADFRNLYGIAADLHVEDRATGRLPGRVETALYRIVQEAMTNAAKHSAARHVSVLLKNRPPVAEVIVEDDGCGFELAERSGSARKGLGLQGMRERAALLEGTLEIESSPGRGTSVYARIPISGGPG